MKTKTKKIIAVVVAVLFTLTIIGAIIVSVVVPKNDKVYASADSVVALADTSRTISSDPPIIINDYLTVGTVFLTIDHLERIYPESYNGDYTVAPYYFIVGNTPSVSIPCYSITITVSAGCITQVKALSLVDNSVLDIYRKGLLPARSYRFFTSSAISSSTSGNTTEQNVLALMLHRFGTSVITSSVADNISSPVRDEAYNEGYNVGYEDGYNKGYDRGYENGHNSGSSEGYDHGYEIGYGEGYDIGVEDGIPQGYETGYNDGHSDGYSAGRSMGHTDQITNPLTAFIDPVHTFMNTRFFGTLTYASIFNVILFVAVAVIFIKMFSGG